MGTLAAGIKDIFSPKKTTGTNVMLCANDGTPDGHMRLSILQSLLGSIPPLGNKTTLLDDITQGCFTVHGVQVFSDTPSDYGLIVAFLANPNKLYAIQFFIDYTGVKFMVRVKWNNDSWGQWVDFT